MSDLDKKPPIQESEPAPEAAPTAPAVEPETVNAEATDKEATPPVEPDETEAADNEATETETTDDEATDKDGTHMVEPSEEEAVEAEASLVFDTEAPPPPAAEEAEPPPEKPKEEKKRHRRGGRQTRYLAQSVLLEESGGSKIVRATIFTLALMVAAGIFWASITRMEEVAVTTGEVIPSGRVQLIQHLEGGVLSAILVREGDLVKKGQVILKLDPAGALSELNQYRARLIGLELKAERLRAFGSGREPDFSKTPEGLEHLRADQETIYAIQMNAWQSRREVIVQQIAQRVSELALQDKQESTLKANLDLLTQELTIREESVKKGVSSPMGLLSTRRDVNQAQGDLANLLLERRKTRQTLTEFKVRLAELDATLKETALSEMGAVTRELAQVRETMAKFEDRVRRLDMTAPVAGVVKGLNVHTVGGVIPPRETLMEIVPLDEELLAEVKISTQDIGHIQVGQPVKVKVLTYDFARYGGVEGSLKKVSASSFMGEDGAPYFQGLVSLSQQHVGFNPRQNIILPGMTVEADIRTGDKTMLQYLLKPVYSSVNEAFRER